MKDDQSFGVHFMIRRDKAQDNVAPIYAKISVDGKQALLSTKYRVAIGAWENKKGLAKSGEPELSQLNTDLELERSAITTCHKALRQEGELLSPHLVRLRI